MNSLDLYSIIHSNLHSNLPFIDTAARVLAVIAIVIGCWAVVYVINLKLIGLIKFLVAALMLSWAGASIWVVCWLPLLMVAKLACIQSLLIGSFVCWFFILTSRQWHMLFSNIQADCELATNLTFLQAEMMRTQLSSLNERIHQSIEPQEIEFTETMLKSLSPLVFLFFQKEKSVIKWSTVALSIGKEFAHYFLTPKR